MRLTSSQAILIIGNQNTIWELIIQLLKMIIRRNRTKNKHILKTQANESLQHSLLRVSLGEAAKQSLRQISQFGFMNNQYIKELDWSASIQDKTPKNKEKQQGCFQITLSKIKAKAIAINHHKICKPVKQDKQSNIKPIQESNSKQHADIIKRKRRNTCGSINYIIGTNSRSKQSRIHSSAQHITESKYSHFYIDEDAFKTAALKLHKHFINMKSLQYCEKKGNSRIQTQLVVHKKRTQKIKTTMEGPQYQSLKYMFVSPKRPQNYTIPFAGSTLPIQKIRMIASPKVVLGFGSKKVLTTI